MIEFEIDVYGQYARFSALADVVEAAAARGTAFGRSKVIDWLGDLDINADRDLFIRTEELADRADGDSLEQAVGFVFDLLADRSRVLGDRYPFRQSVDSLTRTTIQTSFYLDILSMTLAHAYKIETGPDRPTYVFEQVVAGLFHDRGWMSVHTGKFRGNFDETLHEMGKEVSIDMNPEAAIHSRRANDDKVDVLAHFPWRDDRPGRLTAISQVTLEKSSGWERKAKEPSPRSWAKYMHDEIEPISFFAVPHHIEPRQYQRLIETTQSIPLDRLRVVMSVESMPSGASAIRNAVDGTSVSFP